MAADAVETNLAETILMETPATDFLEKAQDWFDGIGTGARGGNLAETSLKETSDFTGKEPGDEIHWLCLNNTRYGHDLVSARARAAAATTLST